MTKWTRGPWHVGSGIFVDDSEGKTICLPVNSFGAERKATAHLIAAAPELYEALVVARDFIENSSHPEKHKELLTKIDDAVAKARGEPND